MIRSTLQLAFNRNAGQCPDIPMLDARVEAVIFHRFYSRRDCGVCLALILRRLQVRLGQEIQDSTRD